MNCMQAKTFENNAKSKYFRSVLTLIRLTKSTYGNAEESEDEDRQTDRERE